MESLLIDSSNPPSQHHQDFRRRFARFLLLALFTLGIYATTLNFPLVADDLVFYGASERLGWQSPWLFLTASGEDSPRHFFRPLPLAAFALIVQIASDPEIVLRFAFLFLNTVCAALLGGLSVRLFRAPDAYWPAAVLFLLHPALEPLVWISSMFDVGYMLCSLAAFLVLLRQDRIDRIPNVAVFYLTLGLFCKETALMSPIVAIPLMWLHDPGCFTRIARWQWAKLFVPIAVYAPVRSVLHDGSLSYASGGHDHILQFLTETDPVHLLGRIVQFTFKAWDQHLWLPVNEVMATSGFNIFALKVLIAAALLTCLLPAIWKKTPPLRYWWVPAICGFLTLLPAVNLLHYAEATMLHSRWMYGTRAFFCLGLAGLWVWSRASRPGLLALGTVWLLVLQINMEPYRDAGAQIRALSRVLEPHLQDSTKDRAYVVSDTLDHDRGALLLRNGFRDFLRKYGGPRWDGGVVGQADGSRASFSVEQVRRGEIDLPKTSLLFSWDGRHHLLTPLEGKAFLPHPDTPRRMLQPATMPWDLVECEARPAQDGSLIISSNHPDPRILYELPGDGLHLRALRFRLQAKPEYPGGDSFFVTRGGALIQRPFEIGNNHQVEVWLVDPLYPARDVVEPIRVIRIDPLGGPGEAILSDLELVE